MELERHEAHRPDTPSSPASFQRIDAGSGSGQSTTFHRFADSHHATHSCHPRGGLQRSPSSGPSKGASSHAPAPDLELSHKKQKTSTTSNFHRFRKPLAHIDSGETRSYLCFLLDGSVYTWFIKALKARKEDEVLELQASSGDHARFDRVIATALTKPEHLKSHFGTKLQSRIEEEVLLRGRVLLNSIGREFDADPALLSVVSELELFSLPPPEGTVTIQSLKAWRDKVRFILGQLPQTQTERPAEKLMSKWFFEHLKRVLLLRRHMDKIRDSAEGAPERAFEWLWARLERTILESQQDQNLQSIQQSLKTGRRLKDTPRGATANRTVSWRPQG